MRACSIQVAATSDASYARMCTSGATPEADYVNKTVEASQTAHTLSIK
jgi:hypothetical protein